MRFDTLVLSLLQAQFWSITPALPGVGGGTRPRVEFPETIPDVTFIARELVAADGFPDPVERNRLNGFIQGARRFHTLYGLNPIMIDSFDDILRHFQAMAAPIGRIRIVSHGNDAFLFLPMFDGGMWDVGMDTPWLQALQTSDEAALRFLISVGNPAASPTLIDGVDLITDGIRARNSAVLAPFGLDAAGSAAGDLLQFFEVVNDLFQVLHGSIGVTTGATTVTMTGPQQAAMNASLGLIEAAIRMRLIGTIVAGNAVTAATLDAFKAAVLGSTPGQLGMLGPPANLPNATVAADVAVAIARPVATREADIRTAIIGANTEPVLGRGAVGQMVGALEIFQPAVLTLGGVVHDEAAINADADLDAFFTVCLDLHFLRNGEVTVNAAPSNAAQRTAVRNGLTEISNLLSTRIRARPGNAITAAQLNTLRTAIEMRPVRESVVTGGTLVYPDNHVFTELTAANAAMAGRAFRTRYDHFRGLMQPADASHVDVRGCLVGARPAFVTTLRDFMGGAVNRPTVSAPNWLQSFPGGFRRGGLNPTVYGEIDALIAAGGGFAPLNITPANIIDSFVVWSGLIDFTPHFDFIAALFAAGASLRDFASLDWRVFRSAAAPAGIPVLRMEAQRVDTLLGLNLGDLIERFRTIFEVPAATPPNMAARGRLTQLQPFVSRLRAINAAIVTAGAAPTAPQLAQFLADLTNVAAGITGIAGFPAAAPPLTPPAAAVLADIQAFATAIGNHVDSLLTTNLGAFFTAVQGATGHANARIRYYFNVGLPLLVQSGAQPTSFAILLFASAPSTVIADAVRSWMRIQWTGTAAQAAAMNGVITLLHITNDAERLAASQVAMLSEDPRGNPAADAGIAPMQKFHDHLVTQP